MTEKVTIRMLLGELFKTIGNVLIFLTNWTVFTSFIEADWWHFSEPATSGISIPGIIALLLAICVSPFLLLFKRVRQLVLSPTAKLVFTMIAPTLLFLASLPQMSEFPAVRTTLLGLGVMVTPLVLTWSLQARIYSVETSCCRHTETKDHRNASVSITNSNCEAQNDNANFLTINTNLSYSTSEFLIAVLLSMTIRWQALTINVLYEAYEASLLLFACVLIYSMWCCIVDLYKPACQEDVSPRKSTGVTIASFNESLEGAINITSQMLLNDVSSNSCASNGSHTLNSVIPPSQTTPLRNGGVCVGVYKTNREDYFASLPVDVKDQHHANKLFTFDKHKNTKLVLYAILQGFTSGTLLAIFILVFSTPALFCRWSGKSPDSHGIAVLTLYAVGVIISALQPQEYILKKLKIKTTTSSPAKNKIWPKIFLTEPSSSSLRKILQVGIVAVLVAILYLATYFLLQGASSPFSFVGSCIFCFMLPITLSINFCSIISLARVSSVMSPNGCTSVLPGIIFIFAAFAFLFFYFLLISFINPQISPFVLGRMDIILTVQVTMISLPLFTLLSIVWWLSEYDVTEGSQQHASVPLSLIELVQHSVVTHKKTIILCFVTVVFLVIGVTVDPGLGPKRCMSVYSGSYSPIFNDTKEKQAVSNISSLSVMSWNVFLGHDMNGRDNLPCLGEVMKQIDPDIIGVQESDALSPYWGGKDILGYLSAYLREKTRSYFGVPPLMSSLGVGILTKLNVSVHKSEILPQSEDSRLPHYSYIRVDVAVGDTTMHVFNVHAVYKNWTASSDLPSPFSNVSHLHMQYLADKVNAINTSNPVIVMGDFNLNPFELELDFMLNVLHLKCALHTTRSANYPSTLRNRHAVIDHIFYRGLNLIVSNVLTDIGDMSDHNPVLAYFEIPT